MPIQPFCTVSEILSIKGIGITTLTFRVTWRHWSCDHWIPKVWFPIGSQYESTMYLTQLFIYWASNISGSNISGSRGVTWRHLSRDHWIRRTFSWNNKRVCITWPLPWHWAHPECGLYWGPSCASLVAIQPFRTVSEIFSFKDIGLTTLTFRVTYVTSSVMWCHYWIPKVWFPIGSQYEPTMYLLRLLRYIKLQSYLGHDLDLLGSRDVICHVTIWFAI